MDATDLTAAGQVRAAEEQREHQAQRADQLDGGLRKDVLEDAPLQERRLNDNDGRDHQQKHEHQRFVQQKLFEIFLFQ